MIADYEGDITKLFEGGENGEVPVLATRNLVLFPGVVSPVLIGRTSSLSLINYLKDRPDEAFAVFCQKNADEDNPIRKDQLYEYGVHAKIIRALEMPGQSGNVTVILQGLGRCRLTGIEGTEPFLRGTVEVAPEKFPDEKDKEFMAAIEDLRSTTAEYVKKNDEIPDEAQFALQNINNPVILLNFISTSLPFDAAEKIKLLKANSMKDRLFKLLKILHREMQLLELKHDIRTKTREDIDEQQREYFLQQQIKNIKEELTGGDSYPERKELTDKAEKKKWPEEIEEVFNKELEKLDILNPQSPEFSVQLTRRPQPEAGREGARPRPLRHEEGEGTHTGTHGRAEPQERPEVADSMPLRSSGSGQDEPRQERGRRHEAPIREDIARRSARRGRNTRTPPHVHRRYAWPHNKKHTEGRLVEPRVHTRRNRQGDPKHDKRRPGVGTARSARPGTELRLPRQLS